jgi:hypothetical protein
MESICCLCHCHSFVRAGNLFSGSDVKVNRGNSVSIVTTRLRTEECWFDSTPSPHKQRGQSVMLSRSIETLRLFSSHVSPRLLRDRRLQLAWFQPLHLGILFCHESTMKVEATVSPATFVHLHQTTRRHIFTTRDSGQRPTQWVQRDLRCGQFGSHRILQMECSD